MAIYPSTGGTRGRSLVSKPLSASNTSGSPGHSLPDLAPKEGTDPSSAPQDLPKDNASPTTLEPVNNIVENDVTKSRDPPLHSEFWLRMTTALDACFSEDKSSINQDEFDTVSDDLLADAPRIMQIFQSHGDACTKMDAEALDLVSNGPGSHEEDEPLKIYNDLLDNLAQLQARATSLEVSISRLAGLVHESNRDEHEQSSKLAAHPELSRIFSACLPVLRARKANLTMAQDLIDSAQENFSISLRMESLGID